jgi:histidine triad (HIT) family protein
MEGCVFCKLLEEGLPPHAIYENEELFVMLDRNSLGFGHVMVIPKTHTDKIYDINDREYQSLLLFSKRLARILEENLETTGVAYVAHSAGLPHTHLHLIPLTEKDEITEPKKHMRRLSDEELKEKAQKLLARMPKNFSEVLSEGF